MSWINAESLYPSRIFIVWFKTHCVVYKNWVVVPKQAEENAEEDYWAHILYPLVFSHKLLSFDSLMFVLKKKCLYLKISLHRNEYLHGKRLHVCASVCMRVHLFVCNWSLGVCLYAFLHEFKWFDDRT